MCACMESESQFELGIQFFRLMEKDKNVQYTLERFVRVFSCLMCSSLTMERRGSKRQEEEGEGEGRGLDK